MIDTQQFVQDEGKAQRHSKELLESSSRTPAEDKDRTRRSGNEARCSRRYGTGIQHVLQVPNEGSEPIETLMTASQLHGT